MPVKNITSHIPEWPLVLQKSAKPIAITTLALFGIGLATISLLSIFGGYNLFPPGFNQFDIYMSFGVGAFFLLSSAGFGGYTLVKRKAKPAADEDALNSIKSTESFRYSTDSLPTPIPGSPIVRLSRASSRSSWQSRSSVYDPQVWIQQADQYKAHFRDEALQRLKEKKMPMKNQELRLAPEKQQQLADHLPYIKTSNPEKYGLKLHSSGEHIVFEIVGCEGLIFKVRDEDVPSPDSGKYTNAPEQYRKDLADFENEEIQHAKKYLDLKKIGWDTIKDGQLYLLQIPPATFVQIGSRYVVVEQKIEDLEGSFTLQESLYRWGLEQSELQDYFKELFSQLLTFICKTGLGDVKYNNIPLSLSGLGCLIDLDNHGAIYGLIRGFAGKGEDKPDEYSNQGLLHYLPQDWIRQYADVASELLQQTIDTQAIEKRVQIRAKKRREHAEFLKRHGIISPNQPMLIDETKVGSKAAEMFRDFDPSKIEWIAKHMMMLVNGDLTELDSFEPQTGRKVAVELGQKFGTTTLWKLVRHDFLEGRAVERMQRYMNYVDATLQVLKALDFIHRYKNYGQDQKIIWC